MARGINWNEIWALKVPNKLNHFMWQCMNDCLSVGKKLERRGIKVGSGCGFCERGDNSAYICGMPICKDSVVLQHTPN